MNSKIEIALFVSPNRFVLNCRCQAVIKTKSSVQVLFFEKQVKMQLLNSNIPRRARTARYGNKKAQDQLNLVLLCFVAFSYYKDGADNRTCSERSERNSISEQVYLQSVAPAVQRAGANKRSAVCRQNVVLFQVRCRIKKDNPFGLSFLVRTTGLEPAQPCDHKNLNLTRLPIPPCPHNG